VVVEKRGSRVRALIPELDLETWVHPRQDLPLNSTVQLAIKEVTLPELAAHFQVMDLVD
jgi:hypothetical protein